MKTDGVLWIILGDPTRVSGSLAAVLHPKTARHPSGELSLGQPGDLLSAEHRLLERHQATPQQTRGANDRRSKFGFPSGAI